MDAVLLGALAGALFGLLAITVRQGLRRGADPEVGAVVVLGSGSLVACALALPQSAALGDPGEVEPLDACLTGDDLGRRCGDQTLRGLRPSEGGENVEPALQALGLLEDGPQLGCRPEVGVRH